MELCELKKGDLIDITYAGVRVIAEVTANNPIWGIVNYKFRLGPIHTTSSCDYYRMSQRGIIYLIEDE